MLEKKQEVYSPEISVLLSCYNAERYLNDAIESILIQSFMDFEFIIVNDGSTDRTKSIIENSQKKDNRINFIDKEKNTGLADSLNVGLKHCNAKWVVRMDADDISLPNRLETQLNFVQNNEVTICGGGANMIDNSGNKLETIVPSRVFGNIEKSICGINPIMHPTVIMNKEEIITLGGYDKKFKYASQDYELWVRAFFNGYKIINIDDILINYRKDYRKKSFKRIFSKFFYKISINKKYNFKLKYHLIALFILINDIYIKIFQIK